MIQIKQQYKNVRVSAYFINAPNPISRIEGIMFSLSSSLGTYNEYTGRLATLNIVHARAFIPCVSENISTDKPNKNDNVINKLILHESGRRRIK